MATVGARRDAPDGSCLIGAAGRERYFQQWCGMFSTRSRAARPRTSMSRTSTYSSPRSVRAFSSPFARWRPRRTSMSWKSRRTRPVLSIAPVARHGCRGRPAPYDRVAAGGLSAVNPVVDFLAEDQDEQREAERDGARPPHSGPCRHADGRDQPDGGGRGQALHIPQFRTTEDHTPTDEPDASCNALQNAACRSRIAVAQQQANQREQCAAKAEPAHGCAGLRASPATPGLLRRRPRTAWPIRAARRLPRSTAGLR